MHGIQKTYIPEFQQRISKRDFNLVETTDMTMAISGMGGIGPAVAARAHYGFNMKILATDAKPLAKPIFVDTLREPAWLPEMVSQADVVYPRAVSRHWRVLELPEPDYDSTYRWIRAATPHPPDGAAGRERPELHQWLAADERGGQTARLLVREEI
jgi:hypothetical protein